LPPGCIERTFYAPTCQSLWPFQGRDNRAVPEPSLYPASRYPHGDRVAQTLAGVGMGEDVLYLMYEAATNTDPVDLDALFAVDRDLWRRQDEQSGITLAPFITAHFRTERMFISPDRIGPALLRQMVWQILHDPLVHDIVGPEVGTAELDALLEGHTGRREELPVHPRVARHFALSWWSVLPHSKMLPGKLMSLSECWIEQSDNDQPKPPVMFLVRLTGRFFHPGLTFPGRRAQSRRHW
jgi:hypothetical protein